MSPTKTPPSAASKAPPAQTSQAQPAQAHASPTLSETSTKVTSPASSAKASKSTQGKAHKKTRVRAQPLAPEERRTAILAALIPLLVEHGNSVTSKQIAEASGVAEGTIFRVFADKKSLIQAAVDAHMDSTSLFDAMAELDPQLPLEAKVRALIELLQERFRTVFALMRVSGKHRHPTAQEREKFLKLVERLLEPEAAQLSWSPPQAAHILRMIGFASSFSKLNDNVNFSPEELTRVCLYGLCGSPEKNPCHPNQEAQHPSER